MVFIFEMEKGVENKINEQSTPKQVVVGIVYREGKVDSQLIYRGQRFELFLCPEQLATFIILKCFQWADLY